MRRAIGCEAGFAPGTANTSAPGSACTNCQVGVGGESCGSPVLVMAASFSKELAVIYAFR